MSVNDVLMMLGDFGCTSDCEADVDLDGSVGISDLLQILSAFGDDC